MKKKPYALNILSLFLLCCAVSFPMQIVFRDGYHLVNDFSQILHRLTDLNYTIMALMIYASYLSFTGHQQLKKVIPLLIALVCVNNFYISYMSFIPYSVTTAASLAFTIPALIMTFTPIQKILEHPELRWWRIPQRFQRQYPVKLSTPEGEEILIGKTFDLSSGGLFVNTGLDTLQKVRELYIQQDSVSITALVERDKSIQLEAQIVRLSHRGRGNYPSGLGLKIKGGKWKERWNWFFHKQKCQWGLC